MPFSLRTLAQAWNLRRASGGKLGASVICLCNACGSRWSVPLDKAIEHLGDAAVPQNLKGQARCPHCSDGVCVADRDDIPYITVDNTPIRDRESIHFSGLFGNALDTIDTFATMKPLPKHRTRYRPLK